MTRRPPNNNTATCNSHNGVKPLRMYCTQLNSQRKRKQRKRKRKRNALT